MVGFAQSGNTAQRAVRGALQAQRARWVVACPRSALRPLLGALSARKALVE